MTVLVTARHHFTGPMQTGEAISAPPTRVFENAYNVDRMLLLGNRLSHLDGSPYRDVKLYGALRPSHDRSLFNAGSYLDFERSALRSMYRAGQEAAAAWLEEGPPVDSIESRRDVPAYRREPASG